MYIDIVPNRGSKPTILLRRSFRKDGKVCKETVANLSGISEAQAHAIRNVLKGENLVKQDDAGIEILHSAAHGHIKAVLLALDKLQINKLLGEENDKDRNLRVVKALIVCDVLQMEPRHTLIRDYRDTTLGHLLRLDKVEEHELHAAMDWLYKRQETAEKQLADRHLQKSSRIITCLSSCYLNDNLEVNFWLITNDQGRPVSIHAYPRKKLLNIEVFREYLDKLLDKPDFQPVILVGDCVKIPQKMIDNLTESKGISWVAGMKTESLLALLNNTNLNIESIFDSCDLTEIPHLDYPEEKFIIWRNPDHKKLRKDERDALMDSTIQSLDEIKELVDQEKLKKTSSIKLRVNKILRKNVLKKYFSIEIGYRKFEYTVDRELLDLRESMDGVFVIRTSLTNVLSPLEIRSLYKKTLTGMAKNVFYSIDTINPKTHPIFTYSKPEANKYLFIRLLATYVEWQIKESWEPLPMFIEHDSRSDENTQDTIFAEKHQRASAKEPVQIPPPDLTTHNFWSLLQHLATITRNTCRKNDDSANVSTFIVDCKLNSYQQKAFDLLKKIRVYR